MGIDKNRKIILNLCLEVPKQEHKLDENVIVGVDVGRDHADHQDGGIQVVIGRFEQQREVADAHDFANLKLFHCRPPLLCRPADQTPSAKHLQPIQECSQRRRSDAVPLMSEETL